MVVTEELSAWKSKRRRSRSGGVGTGPGEGLRAGQSSFCLGLGHALQLPTKDLASALRLFRAAEEGTVRKMCGRAVTDHHGHPARV